MASSFGAKRAENVSALLGEMVKRLVDVEVRAIPPRYPPTLTRPARDLARCLTAD
jgi:hypothetical protein